MLLDSVSRCDVYAPRDELFGRSASVVRTRAWCSAPGRHRPARPRERTPTVAQRENRHPRGSRPLVPLQSGPRLRPNPAARMELPRAPGARRPANGSQGLPLVRGVRRTNAARNVLAAQPAMLYASFVDSVLPWHAYSGDRGPVRVVREMLDFQLAHGTTPSRWAWSQVPFATSCAGHREYGRCFAGMPRSFYGGVEPDKVGQLGLAYARFYELTGERRYLNAAVRSARALARHVRGRRRAAHSLAVPRNAHKGRPPDHARVRLGVRVRLR